MKYLALFMKTEVVSKDTIGKEPAKASKGELREFFRERQNSQQPIGKEPAKPSKVLPELGLLTAPWWTKFGTYF